MLARKFDPSWEGVFDPGITSLETKRLDHFLEQVMQQDLTQDAMHSSIIFIRGITLILCLGMLTKESQRLLFVEVVRLQTL